MKKPRSKSGYELKKIVRFVPAAFSGTGRAYSFNKGLGVMGPNISETNPKKLRKLAQYLEACADYIDFTKNKAQR